MERALLIEFDPNTGERAGGINPKDPNLFCYGWQDLDSIPAREIRLVKDDRDLGLYADTPGVKVLEGKDEINAAIDQIKPERYEIEDQALFLEDLRQRDIKLQQFSGKSRHEILKLLASQGLIGIRKVIPRKL